MTDSNEKNKNREERLKLFDRAMLRSAFTSLFWVAISEKKRRESYKLSDLAAALGKNKSTISRWFANDPNWQLDTIADIASALDLEITVSARDRITGRTVQPHGMEDKVISTTILSETALVYSGTNTNWTASTTRDHFEKIAS